METAPQMAPFLFSSVDNSAVLASRPQIAINEQRGRLAQLVERLLYTQDVGGSSSSPPTIANRISSQTLSGFPSGQNWALFVFDCKMDQSIEVMDRHPYLPAPIAG